MFKKSIDLSVKCSRMLRSQAMSSVGFCGVGIMGSKMAANMVSKGSKVKAFDVNPEAMKNVAGAVACSSPREAASDVDIVFTMLPDGYFVKEALLGPNGIVSGIKKGTLMVDCSTIEPKQAKEFAELAKKNGFRYVDCPVSGGIMGAAAGTLTFMVGGEKEDVKYATPYLMQAGKRIFHCGGPGMGQVTKLCNNLILGVTMAGTAEGFNMGVKAGLDPKVLADVVNVSTGRSWSSEIYNPVPNVLPNVPSSNNYDGGFMVKLMTKDLAMAEATAVTVNCALPMSAAAHQLFRMLINHGLGDKDFAIIYKFLQGKTK